MRNVAQAISWASGQANNPTQSWRRLCLRFVMTAYALQPQGIPNAISGWRRCTQRVTNGSTPPRGALVWWSGPTADGHVALSDGGGYVWSNDVVSPGRIHRIPISRVKSTWPSARLLGWTRDYCGVPIPELQPGQHKATKPKQVHEMFSSRDEFREFIADAVWKAGFPVDIGDAEQIKLGQKSYSARAALKALFVNSRRAYLVGDTDRVVRNPNGVDTTHRSMWRNTRRDAQSLDEEMREFRRAIDDLRALVNKRSDA